MMSASRALARQVPTRLAVRCPSTQHGAPPGFPERFQKKKHFDIHPPPAPRFGQALVEATGAAQAAAYLPPDCLSSSIAEVNLQKHYQTVTIRSSRVIFSPGCVALLLMARHVQSTAGFPMPLTSSTPITTATTTTIDTRRPFTFYLSCWVDGNNCNFKAADCANHCVKNNKFQFKKKLPKFSFQVKIFTCGGQSWGERRHGLQTGRECGLAKI